MFRGERIDPEIWSDYDGPRWIGWIDLFLPMVNNKHGYFQHLPFSGGYLEQPGATMRILRFIQNEYFAYLKEANAL
jgi:hypothetical protein